MMPDFTGSEMDFIDRIQDYIDLDEIESRNELLNKLLRKKTATTREGTKTQLDILSRYKGFVAQPKRGRRTYHIVSGKKYPVKKYPAKNKNVVVVPVKGFKKKQIRDAETGKIVGWE